MKKRQRGGDDASSLGVFFFSFVRQREVFPLPASDLRPPPRLLSDLTSLQTPPSDLHAKKRKSKSLSFTWKPPPSGRPQTYPRPPLQTG